MTEPVVVTGVCSCCLRPTAVAVMCTCGHPASVHTLNPKKVRTTCSHYDESGPCLCKRMIPGGTT